MVQGGREEWTGGRETRRGCVEQRDGGDGLYAEDRRKRDQTEVPVEDVGKRKMVKEVVGRNRQAGAGVWVV